MAFIILYFFLKLIRNEVIAEESYAGNSGTHNMHPAGGCLQRHILQKSLEQAKVFLLSQPPPPPCFSETGPHSSAYNGLKLMVILWYQSTDIKVECVNHHTWRTLSFLLQSVNVTSLNYPTYLWLHCTFFFLHYQYNILCKFKHQFLLLLRLPALTRSF